MGLFGFLKGNSDKTNPNKPEYEGKPYEWFLSDEGKQSFLKYADNWRDMDAYMADMVEVGQWSKESSGGELFDEIQKICTDPKHFKPTERQKTWPCHYLFNFLQAYAEKYKNDKENHSIFLNIKYKTCGILVIGAYLYELSIMVPEDLSELKWPDFLTPEGNPLIYYATNQSANVLPMDTIANIMYIHEMDVKGIDASKESWLYDENIYWNKNLNSYKTSDSVHKTVLETVAYPDVYRKILGI